MKQIQLKVTKKEQDISGRKCSIGLPMKSQIRAGFEANVLSSGPGQCSDTDEFGQRAVWVCYAG